MNQFLRYFLPFGALVLLLAQTSLTAGLSSGKEYLPRNISRGVALHPVIVVSSPTGAKIEINGKFVGTTPLRLNIAVDNDGRSLRTLDFRALRPPPFEAEGYRSFPAAEKDGLSSFVPSVILFDLNIQRVVVLK